MGALTLAKAALMKGLTTEKKKEGEVCLSLFTGEINFESKNAISSFTTFGLKLISEGNMLS